jgi:hypothetical protein
MDATVPTVKKLELRGVLDKLRTMSPDDERTAAGWAEIRK